MLTGAGLIGKLVEFLATKLLGRKVDLALDDRRRGCRAFTELYYCVDRLEEITSHFLNEIDDAYLKGNAYGVINEFHNHSHTIESVSRRFLEVGSELAWAVEIFDPALAAAVEHLFSFKYSFLYFLSDSIEIKDREEKKFQLLEYKEPSPKILKLDMDSYYEWVRRYEGEKIDRDRVEWPINFLRFSEFEEGFTDVAFDAENIEAAKHFREVIKTHTVALSEARKKLREFLITNFKLEEVLYVSKGLPRDWY